jgi:hypothetical protein
MVFSYLKGLIIIKCGLFYIDLRIYCVFIICGDYIYWARDMIIFMMVIIHFFYIYICVFHLLKELFEEFHDKMV